MIASSTVLDNKSTLTSQLNSYTSTIGDLSGKWEGASYNGITTQSSNFISEFKATIEGQMESFAEASRLYNEYRTAKANVSKFNGTEKLQQYIAERDRLAQEIKAALEVASSVKLEATAIQKTATSSGEFINYYQYNYKQPYSQGTIATSGCGPTSLAMVLTNLLGREVSPVETAEKGNGKYTCSSGTKWSYFGDMAQQYGVNCEQMSSNQQNILSSLQAGKKVILSMGPGHFTKRGHFIVARGIDSNGRIIVSDPNSEERSKQTWDIGTLVNESKQMWAMSA